MALITSAASGNFNAGATWTGGVVPTTGDEARAATGHTVTINVNTTCDEISNAGTGIFTLNDGITLTANVTNKSSILARICLQFTAASPSTATINGNCQGGNASGAVAVANTSSGTLSIVGNCTAGTTGGTAYGANNAATGTINVTGTCRGGSVAGSNHYGVNNASSGTVNITGSCVGGTTSGGLPTGANNASSGTINITGDCTGANSGSSGQGAQNAGTGVLNITGNVTAGSATLAFGANNASTGTLSVIGTIQSSQTAAGVTGSNVLQQTILSGPFLTETVRGVAPVYCAAWRWNASPSNSTYMEVMTNDLLAKRNLVTADNITGMPAASNVKSGIAYGPSSELTGTFSQTVTPSTADIATAVWSAASRTITEGGITAADVWSAASRTITGGTVDTLVNAPTVPSAIQIRQEMDSNSTKLANLDAAVSSRLAPSGTLAVVTTLTNAPTVPTAAAIASQVRTELGTELGRIDAAITSRATPGDIPTESEIAAEIWAKPTTELTITGSIGERAKNQSTVSTTGAQLAAALS